MKSPADSLTEASFILYAANHYRNPIFDDKEFYDDLKRFKYIKRLLNQYHQSGDMKERLLLNHMIILGNVFGVEPATRMLFLKLKGFYAQLKPFLVLLNWMPSIIQNIDGINIDGDAIPLDPAIIELLRKI